MSSTGSVNIMSDFMIDGNSEYGWATENPKYYATEKDDLSTRIENKSKYVKRLN